MNARKFFKNFQILKFLFFSFFIFHFSFFIFGCSSSTEISKGDLTGSVYLDGSDDHTGISVALYDLAYLDTTIVRINHEYPHIGVIINQHTEFDHRLQSPVATSTTLADGSFIIEDVPTGVYNFVAQKVGYGFRYIYEISISEGENELSSMYNERCIMNNAKADFISTENSDEALAMTERRESAGMERFHASSKSRSEQDYYSSFIIHSSLNRISDLTLYPELHLSGDVNDAIVVASFHHLVCDDDVTFIPGSSLEIQPNAVVRIAPGSDLKIMGNFKAQGEENNMFWVTSNDGFAEGKSEKGEVKSGSISHFTFPLSRESIELYNSMQLSPFATVENDLIEWGKWDWGTIFTTSTNDIYMQNNIIRNFLSGLIIEGNNWNVENNLFAESSNNKALNFNNSSNIMVEKTIFLECYYGLEYNNISTGTIKNCYFIRCGFGVQIYNYSEEISVNNNEFLDCINYAVKVYYYTSPLIEYNNITGKYGVLNTEMTGCWSIPEIHYNNINCTTTAIKTIGNLQVYDIPAQYNYFYSIDENYISEQLIWDYEDASAAMQENGLGHILFQPILSSEVSDAGISSTR
jgi:hypothetical protein